jgi:hypothetical protein
MFAFTVNFSNPRDRVHLYLIIATEKNRSVKFAVAFAFKSKLVLMK